jgi:hypothetical protein
MHASGEVHATRRSNESPPAFGVGWIDHPLPGPPVNGISATATANAALPAHRIVAR